MNVFHPLSTAAVITCLFFVHIHTFLDFLPSVSSNGVQEEDIEEQGLLRKWVFEVEDGNEECANPICDSKAILCC
jgi:hypothetical protein